MCQGDETETVQLLSISTSGWARIAGDQKSDLQTPPQYVIRVYASSMGHCTTHAQRSEQASNSLLLWT